MQSFRHISVKRVFEYLRSSGWVGPEDVPEFELSPVSFQQRQDRSILFAADAALLAECADLNHCVIIGPDCDHRFENDTLFFVPSPDPRSKFFDIVSKLFVPQEDGPSIHPTSVIDRSSRLGRNVMIGPNVVIGEHCEIGDRTEIRANVVLHRGVTIGHDCLVKSGTVIGQEGFGIYEDEDGIRQLIPHVGGVRIGNRVLIGSMNTVCSGTIDPTTIGDDTKFDDHIHVAHNCIIGKSVTITACAELSGSVTIEDNVWVGPQAAILNKLTIGEGAFIGLGAVVTKHVATGAVVAGNPARVLRVNS